MYSDGVLYVVGGTTGHEYSIDVHCLDLNTRVWQHLSPYLITTIYLKKGEFLNTQSTMINYALYPSQTYGLFKLDHIQEERVISYLSDSIFINRKAISPLSSHGS